MPSPSRDFQSPEAEANFFVCLADPSRLVIIRLLLENEEMTMTEIQEAASFGQAFTSRHLALLRKYDTVIVREVHRYRYYRLRPDLVAKVRRCLE